MATPNSIQVISKLGGWEGFHKSTRSQTRYQTWSAQKNHKACHASTWDGI